MNPVKILKDHLAKALLGAQTVPRGLLELHDYFRKFGVIEFDFIKEHDEIIARSKNFRYGAIVTAGRDAQELDAQIKDAILTAFDVPSAYAKEANIVNTSESHQYALA